MPSVCAVVAAPAAPAAKVSRQDRTGRDKHLTLIKNGILAAMAVIVLLVIYANRDTWFMPEGRKKAQAILAAVEEFMPRLEDTSDLTLKELQRVKDDLNSIPAEYPLEYKQARGFIGEVDKVIAAITAEQAAAALVRQAQETFDDIIARYESGMANEESAVRELLAFKLNFPDSPAAREVDGRIRAMRQAAIERWTQAFSRAETEVDKLIDQKAFRSAREVLERYTGGVFAEALRTAELFLPAKSIILRTLQQEANLQNYISSNPSPFDFDLAILVNQKTASSAEILAGALQDHGKGVVIGTKTFGKGVIEKTFTLENEFRVKFITAAMLTPKGRSWDAKGILPDFLVEQDEKILKSLLLSQKMKIKEYIFFQKH